MLQSVIQFAINWTCQLSSVKRTVSFVNYYTQFFKSKIASHHDYRRLMEVKRFKESCQLLTARFFVLKK